jgi:hypothetical protein
MFVTGQPAGCNPPQSALVHDSLDRQGTRAFVENHLFKKTTVHGTVPGTTEKKLFQEKWSWDVRSATEGRLQGRLPAVRGHVPQRQSAPHLRSRGSWLNVRILLSQIARSLAFLHPAVQISSAQ